MAHPLQGHTALHYFFLCSLAFAQTGWSCLSRRLLALFVGHRLKTGLGWMYLGPVAIFIAIWVVGAGLVAYCIGWLFWAIVHRLER